MMTTWPSDFLVPHGSIQSPGASNEFSEYMINLVLHLSTYKVQLISDTFCIESILSEKISSKITPL